MNFTSYLKWLLASDVYKKAETATCVSKANGWLPAYVFACDIFEMPVGTLNEMRDVCQALKGRYYEFNFYTFLFELESDAVLFKLTFGEYEKKVSV